jgi:hypothetical protein
MELIQTNRYKNGKIYKIVCNVTGKIYIGSTCAKTLAHRLAQHTYNYTYYVEGRTKKSLTSFKVLENNNYSIILLEEYPCETKEQLLARERYYIENTECVNKCVPCRTYEESLKYQLKYQTEYNKNNKNEVSKYQKEYYEKNKEQLLKRRYEYVKNNKDKIRKYQKEYHNKKKQILLQSSVDELLHSSCENQENLKL